MKKTFFLLVSFALFLTCDAYADGGMSSDMDKIRSSMTYSILRNNLKKTQKDLDDFKAKIDMVVEKHPEDKGYADFTMAEIYGHTKNPALLNYAESDRLYREAAKELKNDKSFYALALYNIGMAFYQKREGMTQNFDSAYVYIERAADLNPRYKVGVGAMAEFGLGVNRDPMYALACYEEANRGGGDAYMKAYALRYALEKMEEGTLDQEAYEKYVTGCYKMAVDNDVEAAMKNFRESAARGYLPAMADLGTLIVTDKVKERFNEGMKYLKESAEAGYVPAMHNYALYYYEKRMMSAKGALEYYEKAALQGFAPSQFAVANLLFGSNAKDKAYVWYGACVKQGYNVVHVMLGSAKSQYESIGKKLPAKKKPEYDKQIDEMPTSLALSVKVFNAFSKIPMFEGSKATTSEEKEQQTGTAFSGNTALSAQFYQSEYDKYGRKVQSELKNENPNLEYVKSLQGVMSSIASQAEEKGFTINRNEYEKKILE